MNLRFTRLVIAAFWQQATNNKVVKIKVDPNTWNTFSDASMFYQVL